MVLSALLPYALLPYCDQSSLFNISWGLYKSLQKNNQNQFIVRNLMYWALNWVNNAKVEMSGVSNYFYTDTAISVHAVEDVITIKLHGASKMAMEWYIVIQSVSVIFTVFRKQRQ